MAAGQQVAAWGAAEYHPGLTSHVASDGRGSVYVTDGYARRVDQHGDTGAVVRAFEPAPASGGAPAKPRAITIGPEGDVWVSDDVGHRVHRYSADGRLLDTIAVPKGPPGDIWVIQALGLDVAGRLVVMTGFPGKPGFVHVLSAGGVGVRSSALRYRKGRVAVKVRCAGSSACRGMIRIKKGGSTLASRRYSIRRGKIGIVSVKPTRRGRRIIARAGKHRVTVRLTPSTGATVTKTLTLRR